MGSHRAPTLAAYECWLRGAKHHELRTPDALADARRCYEDALVLDPSFARAYAGLAEIAYMETTLAGWGTEKADDYDLAHRLARKAVELDPTAARPHDLLGMILMARHDWVAAQRHWNLSAQLDPNDADAAMCRATGIAYLGRPEEAYAMAQMAMRLNPHYPTWYLFDLGVIRFAQRKYRDCLDCYDRILDLYPYGPAWRAAAAAHLGLQAEARQHAELFLASAAKAWAGSEAAGPSHYVAWFIRHVPIRLAADRAHLVEGLRKASLPA